MSRQRLSWDKEKVAEITKTADPYTMNQKRDNPPAGKYDTGDSYDFGEQPDMKHRWDGEKRTETGHPAPAREAVKAARKLEDRAIKCITIAQRMLPGASDDVIEEQATDLMYMPEQSILSTLQRQASLAETLTASDDEDEKEEEKDEKEAAKKEEKAEEKKEEEVPVVAKKDEKEEKAEEKKEEEVPVMAKKEEKEEKAEEKKEEEVPVMAKKDEKEKAEKEEEVPVMAKKDEKKEKKDDDADLLDKIFAVEEIVPEKTGAKKLSGIVKQASSSDPLDSLWDAPPDVSKVFGR